MKLPKLFQKNTYNIFETERTNNDLENFLENYKILLNIPSSILISIRFNRKAKRVLGSVRLKNKVSVIYITQYLADYYVPDYVLEEVILHELIHIKTGHGSTLEKTSKHAHRGGVIRKEMLEVGREDIYDLSQAWIKKNWYTNIRNYNKKQKLLAKVQSKKGK